jgi:hypothetical protein
MTRRVPSSVNHGKPGKELYNKTTPFFLIVIRSCERWTSRSQINPNRRRHRFDSCCDICKIHKYVVPASRVKGSWNLLIRTQDYRTSYRHQKLVSINLWRYMDVFMPRSNTVTSSEFRSGIHDKYLQSAIHVAIYWNPDNQQLNSERVRHLTALTVDPAG